MQLIQITARNCNDRVQSEIKLGKQYFAKQTEPLKDGTMCLIVRANNRSKPHKINAKRFNWKEVKLPIAKPKTQTMESTMLEKKEMIKENIDIEKIPHLVVSPFIIYRIIIDYTCKALQIAASERISDLTKLSRRIKELLKFFEDMHVTSLDRQHYDYIINRTEAFQAENTRDFTLLYYTINSLIKKYSPTFRYIELSTNVLLAMLFIHVSDKHLHETSELIDKQTGLFLNNTRPQVLDTLYTCLDAMAGNIEIKKIIGNELFKRCINTAYNLIKRIEYTVDDKGIL